MGNYVFDGWTSAQTIYVETHLTAPEGWSQYWNWDSKQVDVTPEQPEEGTETEEPDPVFETKPDKPCGANIVWGYTRPAPEQPTT